MEKAAFIQIIAAVLAGNTLSGAYIYFLWHASKTNDGAEMKFSIILSGIVPPLVIALGAYFYL